MHKAYGCPPMTYALKLLFSQQVLEQLGCWVSIEFLSEILYKCVCTVLSEQSVYMYSTTRIESIVYYVEPIIQTLYPNTSFVIDACNHQPNLLGSHRIS